MTDNIVIPSDWTFKNQSVAEGFDRHVREQLPWYDLATGAVAHIARHYLPENGRLYDIGTSTGNMCRALSETLKSRHIETYAIEPSEQMMSMWSGPRDIELLSDNAEDVTYQPYDVAICFLVLDRKSVV